MTDLQARRNLTPEQIEANVKAYLKDRKPALRYSSFDYCFNYFQSYRESGQLSKLGTGINLQQSCLHLGFYLASWGMFRGSSPLLTKSVKHYAPVIELVASSPSNLWEIDAHQYSAANCAALVEMARKIRDVLSREVRSRASEILATKIMLGVFGGVSAFDNRFKKGFNVSVFGHKALGSVSEFYKNTSDLVERYRVPTLDFDSGADSQCKYTRAKVIDMIFFVEGGPRR